MYNISNYFVTGILIGYRTLKALVSIWKASKIEYSSIYQHGLHVDSKQYVHIVLLSRVLLGLYIHNPYKKLVIIAVLKNKNTFMRSNLDSDYLEGCI